MLPLLLAPSVLTGLESDFSGGLPSFLNFFRSDAERLSVAYQPLPLKMMPAGWNTFFSLPPHASQLVNGASLKL